MISLVTGGCGFIGSHMVDRLLAEGHEVRVIDNMTTGRPQNLEHRKDDRNLTVYRMDIRNREEIEPVFHGADYIFHLAALADIVPSIRRPCGRCWRTQTTGGRHPCGCRRASGRRRRTGSSTWGNERGQQGGRWAG